MHIMDRMIGKEKAVEKSAYTCPTLLFTIQRLFSPKSPNQHATNTSHKNCNDQVNASANKSITSEVESLLKVVMHINIT